MPIRPAPITPIRNVFSLMDLIIVPALGTLIDPLFKKRTVTHIKPWQKPIGRGGSDKDVGLVFTLHEPSSYLFEMGLGPDFSNKSSSHTSYVCDFLGSNFYSLPNA